MAFSGELGQQSIWPHFQIGLSGFQVENVYQDHRLLRLVLSQNLLLRCHFVRQHLGMLSEKLVGIIRLGLGEFPIDSHVGIRDGRGNVGNFSGIGTGVADIIDARAFRGFSTWRGHFEVLSQIENGSRDLLGPDAGVDFLDSHGQNPVGKNDLLLVLEKAYHSILVVEIGLPL